MRTVARARARAAPASRRESPVAIIAFGLGSLVFLSALLIVAALMLRGQWDQMGRQDPPDRRNPRR